MKSIIHRLTTAAAGLFAVATSIPEAHASLLTLDGTGYYKLGSKETFYGNGRGQSGRYRNLGAGYYHSGELGIKRITNASTYTTESMSFELWAMPYLGATSGPILMTYGLAPLKARYHYSNVVAYGNALSLNKRRFPEFDLFEYGDKGWRYRDTLTFTKKDLL